MMIICLLLSSCQLNNNAEIPTVSGTKQYTEPYTEPYTEVFNPEEETSALADLTSAITSLTTLIGSAVTSTKATTKPVTTKTTTAKATTTKPTATKPTTTKATATQPAASANEIRAIWISCYDYTSAAGKTREQYKSITDTMFRNIRDMGLNTAFVHLRAFSDAFYKSDIYPYSSYIAGKEGASLAFDPFEVLLESAKTYGISVHGWINPFRVSTKKDTSLLSASNPAKKILDAGNADGQICILSNGIYYNPSHTANHKLIIDGVREIIGKYDIDGIHIDDYFYPSTSAEVDKIQYNQYKANGGKLSLSEWRISCVNAFVSALYSAVKTADPALTVSISPAGSFEKNYNEYYADFRLWLSAEGYADLIIPQIYFGFEHETLGFEKLLKQWGTQKRNSKVKLVCGIAAYKCALKDSYAGAGTAEWQKNSDILARQLKCIRSNGNYCGFAVFSYQDLTRNACKTEIQNLKNAVNTGN